MKAGSGSCPLPFGQSSASPSTQREEDVLTVGFPRGRKPGSSTLRRVLLSFPRGREEVFFSLPFFDLIAGGVQDGGQLGGKEGAVGDGNFPHLVLKVPFSAVHAIAYFSTGGILILVEAPPFDRISSSNTYMRNSTGYAPPEEMTLPPFLGNLGRGFRLSLIFLLIEFLRPRRSRYLFPCSRRRRGPLTPRS